MLFKSCATFLGRFALRLVVLKKMPWRKLKHSVMSGLLNTKVR